MMSYYPIICHMTQSHDPLIISSQTGYILINCPPAMIGMYTGHNVTQNNVILLNVHLIIAQFVRKGNLSQNIWSYPNNRQHVIKYMYMSVTNNKCISLHNPQSL